MRAWLLRCFQYVLARGRRLRWNALGAHGLTPEAIRNVIRAIKGLTPKPVAMNLWVSTEDEGALTSTEERSEWPIVRNGCGQPL
jgi:hypothetical protein